MSIATPSRIDFLPLFDAPAEPPFEPADGCRVVARDPSVLDFVLHWWPVLADVPAAAKAC